MRVSVFGPPFWTVLEAISGAAPEILSSEDKARYVRLFNVVAESLPCGACRKSFAVFQQELPLEDYYDTRDGLLYFLYLLHDKVNRKLGKQSPPFEEMLARIEGMRAKCGKTGCVEGYTDQKSADIPGYAADVVSRFSSVDFQEQKETRRVSCKRRQMLKTVATILLLIIFAYLTRRYAGPVMQRVRAFIRQR